MEKSNPFNREFEKVVQTIIQKTAKEADEMNLDPPSKK
jgi:hypothetical protein